jgi:SAM-dependent methyltransferase
MDTHAYEEMANIQDLHWWFKARREILSQEITKLGLVANAQILEIGCGPGGNINMLQQHGTVSAVEMDKFSREFATHKSNVHVKDGWLPNNLPFRTERFDLICMFDVLEHIYEDVDALAMIKTLLNPGGFLLITVPAYQWLFGKHDKMLHHHRRYTLTSISKMLREKGYKPFRQTYFNSLLFPLVIIARLFDFLSHSTKSLGSGIPVRPINKFFYQIFCFERRLLKYWKLPFGSSILIISR